VEMERVRVAYRHRPRGRATQYGGFGRGSDGRGYMGRSQANCAIPYRCADNIPRRRHSLFPCRGH
jgi:hypothetical protein